MKRIVALLGIVIIVILSVVFFQYLRAQGGIVSPIGGNTNVTEVKRPLDAYSIESLATRIITPSQISFGDVIETTDAYVVRPFWYSSDGKRVSGLAHLPVGTQASQGTQGLFPVIVQFRGYVDPTVYTQGMGTKRSAEVFAKNGFVSLAPDFLGYGTSDPLSGDIFLDRFETYTSALTLLSSLSGVPFIDPTRVGIWGHSNGGQIAITVLEITKKPYPTTLWAPVTKPFPYSILYYTDDADDRGKFLRKKLSEFEQLYDVERYSLTNYLDFITAPVVLHQGTADDAVPLSWSNAFVGIMKEKGKDLMYHTYPGADHNMQGSWNTVVLRDIAFFREHLR